MSKEMEKRGQSAVETFQPDTMMPADLFEPVGFRDLVLHQQSYANQVLAKVADVVGDAAFGKGAYDGMKKEARYVVQMGDDLKKAIEEGKVKLDYKKTGEIFAQLRDASGHFGEKLPIKKELIAAGIDPLSVGNALQMKAIEQKLNAMIDTLEDIGQDVSEVIQGQHNDRIGLFNSGLNLYLESRNIQNPDFRMLVVAQALKSLSDGNEQILQALRADASYLLEGKYKLKKGRSAEEIQERMININKCFDVIHRSYMLKAGIYYERGEIQAMLSSMDEYGKFLQHEIVPVAPRLAEFDKTDTLLQGGKWEKRALMLTDLGAIKNQLASTSVFYLGTEEDNNGEG